MAGKRPAKSGARGPQQVHMNRVKFDPYRYKQEDQKIPASTLATMTSLCCRRCCDILQWKVDYGKYIPLERHRKCNICHEKTVTYAYHHICQRCAEEQCRCAKCQKPPPTRCEVVNPEENEGCERNNNYEDGNKDDTTCDELSDAEPQKCRTTSKYMFVEEEDSDEELKPLCGLDIRQVKRRKLASLRQQESELLSRMRERDRRTALRRSVWEGQRHMGKVDSDEEIL
ncbi:hypothetical protein TRVL_05483 [Trypanosoma vivax]|nr:hypothetical protein TRVL_05483 [Trypanosoma vivax]